LEKPFLPTPAAGRQENLSVPPVWRFPTNYPVVSHFKLAALYNFAHLTCGLSHTSSTENCRTGSMARITSLGLGAARHGGSQPESSSLFSSRSIVPTNYPGVTHIQFAALYNFAHLTWSRVDTSSKDSEKVKSGPGKVMVDPNCHSQSYSPSRVGNDLHWGIL